MPSCLNADPKKQGNSFRSATVTAILSSCKFPVSRYSSIKASLHMAVCSSSCSRSSPYSSCAIIFSTVTILPSSLLCSSVSILSRSVPGWSILFTNKNTGTSYLFNNFHNVYTSPCTPSLPSITRIAASSTCSVRSISAEKSTCPGVSNRVISTSFHRILACLEKIVIPLFLSMSPLSRKASP